jgi:hypothetical protein
MARKVRVEFAGACYHVINRGNDRCDFFTADFDLLIARDRANQALVKRGLEILPDGDIRALGDEGIARWVVVRVNDALTVDRMTEACGIGCEDAAGGIETEIVDGVPIPFAGAELMLRMKQSARE